MKNKLLPLIILVLLIGIGLFFFLKKPIPTQTSTTEQKLPIPTGHYDLGDNSTMYHEKDPYEIKVTNAGFDPETVTIKVGDIVVFKNSDKATHNIQSDPHPQHTLYKQLNLGNIEGIDTKSLMFPKVGTYTFHDHLNPSNTGTIIVE